MNVAIVQAHHPEYAQLSADARHPLLLDRRWATDPTRFTGVLRLTTGGGEST